MYVRSIEKKAPRKKSFKLRAILLAILIGGIYILIENTFVHDKVHSHPSDMTITTDSSLRTKPSIDASKTVDLFQPFKTSASDTPSTKQVSARHTETPRDASSVNPAQVLPTKKILLKTAEKAIGDGQIKEAFFTYIQALKQDPHDTKIVDILLNISFASEKSYKPWLDILAQHFPRNTYIYAEISDRFSQVEDYKSAIMWMDKALKISPSNMTLHQNKAVYHDHLSQWQQATVHYQQVLTLIDQDGKTDAGIDRNQIESRLNYLLTKTK